MLVFHVYEFSAAFIVSRVLHCLQHTLSLVSMHCLQHTLSLERTTLSAAYIVSRVYALSLERTAMSLACIVTRMHALSHASD